MTPKKVRNLGILYFAVHAASTHLLMLFFFSITMLITTTLHSTNAFAQVTTPANINGGNPVNTNFLGGTTGNSQNFGSLSGLGLNQGESFTFSGQPVGTSNWNTGFRFLNNQVLQFQPRASSLPNNFVNYEFNFTNTIYGLQFRLSGLDVGDETVVTFFRQGTPVPVIVNTFVDGNITVPRANNIIAQAGTNIDISPNGNGFIADGDGNNDAGGISIHGAEEGFLVSLPIGVGVDEVRFSRTGKNNGSNGNATLILTDLAWARPNIAVTKLDSFSQGGNGESNVGDIITYTYTVTNNGNVPINNVALEETGFSGTGTTPIPVFSSGTGGPTPANLPQGETLTYTVNYSVTAQDLLNGFVDNQATLSGLAGNDVAGQEITDLSDSENSGDGGAQGSLTEDDNNRTDFPAPIIFNPSIEAVKIADTSGVANPALVGNNIIYNITVTNSGDVDLSNISLSDTLTNAGGTSSNPTPSFISSTSSSPNGSLIIGESATYEFTHSVTQADIDSESISNTLTATATPFTGGSISDISDDGNDGDGNTVDDPTITSLPATPSFTITKIANNTQNIAAGITVTYSYRVTNNGNQTLTNISLSDVHNGNGAAPIPDNEVLDNDVGTIGDSIDNTASDGVWNRLAPGDTILFTADYTVTQADVDTLQ